MNLNRQKIFKICLAGMFLAIGWLMPFLTGQIPEIGNKLSPMHIPVLLSGFILGPFYGLGIGFITPITRSLFFGMPPLFPNALAMAFELATYGMVSGLLFKYFYSKNKRNEAVIILTLIIAMISGRIIWGTIQFLLNLIIGNFFTFKMFLNGSLILAWPGIVVQVILIPVLISILLRTRVLDNLLGE